MSQGIATNRNRILTAIVMCLLLVIDWTRGTQSGRVWYWTVNMTGVCMAIYVGLQWGWKGFCRRIFAVWLALGPVILTVCYLFLGTHPEIIYRGQIYSAVMAVWILGFLYIRLFWEAVIYRCRKLKLDAPLLFMSLLLLLVLLSRNEDLWPLFFLLIFFPVYQISTINRVQTLQGIVDALIIMFFIFQGHSFVLRPFDGWEKRYHGFYVNSNVNALFYAMVYTAFLLRAFRGKRRATKVICWILAAGMWGFVLLTSCRSAILAMLGVSSLFLILGRLIIDRRRAGVTLAKVGLFVILAVASLPIDYVAVRYIPPVFHHPVWFDGEYREERVHSFDPWDSWKYVSFEDVLDLLSGRVGKYWRQLVHAQELLQETIAVSETPEELSTVDEDGSVNVRLVMWKYYLQNGKLFGRSNEDGHYLDRVGQGNWYIWHTQNLFVQFWYYYGIVAAFILVVWLCYNGIVALVECIKGDEVSLGILLFLTIFVVYGMPEAVWYPGQFIFFLAFFLPALLKKREINMIQ